eukprot:CAMPEP_0115136262 /NCGR_PEP_ID=MMETSP0227-20121206/56269_1 /TAXON_ID=89957 /ORGANISM="Polarella glacialis, Strain CCMP 1383" /LENGTH=36 /DNA_ID= /DNA_START= /DNA_END= /DNA_ORIENTATION=
MFSNWEATSWMPAGGAGSPCAKRPMVVGGGVDSAAE